MRMIITAEMVQVCTYLAWYLVEWRSTLDRIYKRLSLARMYQLDRPFLGGSLDTNGILKRGRMRRTDRQTCEIFLQRIRGIPCWITTDEYRLYFLSLFLFYSIDHFGHLVKLLGTDVRAIGEPEINEIPLSEKILVCKWLFRFCFYQFKRPADKCLSIFEFLHFLAY